MCACSQSQHDPTLHEEPGVIWDEEVSHVCFSVSGSDHSRELYSVWNTTWRDTLGPMERTKNRVVKKFEMMSHKRKKRPLGQRRLRDAVANIFKNVKDIHLRDRLVLLFLCCI